MVVLEIMWKFDCDMNLRKITNKFWISAKRLGKNEKKYEK